MRVWVGAFLCTAAFGCGRSGVPIGETDFGNPDIPFPEGMPGTPDGLPSPVIDTGRGLDGPIVFDAGLTELDDCEVVASAEGTSVRLAGFSAPFGDGRRVVIAQMNDELVDGESGETQPVADFKRAGQWEIAEIVTRNGSDITLLAPLKHLYESELVGARAQACLVHEWTDVTLAPGATLSPTEWNGSTGGIFAAQISGRLLLGADAHLSADASGFRGGLCGLPSSEDDVTGYEVLEGFGGGKGEGLDARFFSRFGRGAAANAGGGGNGLNAGGGGGGGVGAGGKGGRQRGSTTTVIIGEEGTHGLDGGPAADGERIVFGGGGGAGHLDSAVGALTCGGTGGGAIVLRTKSIAGIGWISADGEHGRQVERNGGGGGGAGGTVDIETSDASQFAGFVTANGGEGADVTAGVFTTTTYGPGGGGGGGSIRAKGMASSPYTIFAIGGDSGTNEANGTVVGADSGEDGAVIFVP